MACWRCSRRATAVRRITTFGAVPQVTELCSVRPIHAEQRSALGKSEYNACLGEINELKARISRAKAPLWFVAPAPAADGLAEQIQKLADLEPLECSQTMSSPARRLADRQ